MVYVLCRCKLCDVYFLKTLRFGTLTFCGATFCNVTSCDVYIMLLYVMKQNRQYTVQNTKIYDTYDTLMRKIKQCKLASLQILVFQFV